MARAHILAALRAALPGLERRFGVAGLALFGSQARGEAGPDSDIDVLVRFGEDARPTLFTLSQVRAALETDLGGRVDLVPEASLDARIAPYVAADRIDA